MIRFVISRRKPAFLKHSEPLLSLALLGVLVVLLVPLPPVRLDLLIATNLGITILLLLITLGATQPLFRTRSRRIANAAAGRRAGILAFSG